MPKKKKAVVSEGYIVSDIGFLMEIQQASVSDLARRTGLSRQSIRKLRDGDFDSIHLETLAALCRELNADVQDLLHYETETA